LTELVPTGVQPVVEWTAPELAPAGIQPEECILPEAWMPVVPAGIHPVDWTGPACIHPEE